MTNRTATHESLAIGSYAGAVEGVDRNDMDVGGQVLLERSSFRRLDRRLARDNCADLGSCPPSRRSAFSEAGEQRRRRTRSKDCDDLVEVLCLDRVDDKVAFPRHEVSIPHRRKPSACRPPSAPIRPRGEPEQPHLYSPPQACRTSPASHTRLSYPPQLRISTRVLVPRQRTDVPLPPSLAQAVRVHLPHLSHPNDPDPNGLLLVLHSVQARR